MFIFQHKKSGKALEATFEQFDDEWVNTHPVTLTQYGTMIFIMKDRKIMEEIQQSKCPDWLYSSADSPYIDPSLDMSEYQIVELAVK